ncbi:hypothetical protein BGM25_24415 [Bacillus sp. FJAT-29953]|nr:hypothetical protein [Bacillus sp. FJAT-29953]
MYEKLYFIYNPLTGCKDWVSEREFNVGSLKLKSIFGVLYFSDLKIMLHFNAPFKTAIVKEYKLANEQSIALHHVCRLINQAELMEFLNQEAKNKAQNDNNDVSYPSSVELGDGYFIWNEHLGCYEQAAVLTTD